VHTQTPLFLRPLYDLIAPCFYLTFHIIYCNFIAGYGFVRRLLFTVQFQIILSEKHSGLKVGKNKWRYGSFAFLPFIPSS